MNPQKSHQNEFRDIDGNTRRVAWRPIACRVVRQDRSRLDVLEVGAELARYVMKGILIKLTLGHLTPQILPHWNDFHARLDEPENREPVETDGLQG